MRRELQVLLDELEASLQERGPEGLIYKEKREHLDRLDQKLKEWQQSSSTANGKPKMVPLSVFEQREQEKKAVHKEVRDCQQQIEEFQNQLKHFINEGKELLQVLDNLQNPSEPAGRPFLAVPPSAIVNKIRACYWREKHRFATRLPIYSNRSAIIDTVLKHQVVVLTAETGTGKSTQIGQYLLDLALQGVIRGRIACTQPRRVAAASLARRVATEYGCRLGGEVSYVASGSWRSLTNSSSQLVFMTDRSLLQAFLNEPQLSEYGVVVVDEAHERTLHSDLLLGMLKRCLELRPELKVLVMSATIDARVFTRFFSNACPLHLEGRNYPIQITYVPAEDAVQTAAHRDWPMYFRASLEKALAVHAQEEEEGNILVFLTTPQEVEFACREAARWLEYQGTKVKPAVVSALHGKLTPEGQLSALAPPPHGARKITFATNIAETSLTLPGIRYVVDCGMAKERRFDVRRGITSLCVVPTDQSAAVQRAGRAGRTGPGLCFRMYSAEDFARMEPGKVAEMHRVPLGLAVMQLLLLGLEDIKTFQFVEPPHPLALQQAVAQLQKQGALDAAGKQLTDLGRQMARLGIDPPQAKLVLDGVAVGLTEEVLVLAGMMKSSGGGIFMGAGGSPELRSRVDCHRAGFAQQGGDLITHLCIYRHWECVPEARRNWWCRASSISSKSMRQVRETVEEIRQTLWYELNIRLDRRHQLGGYQVELNDARARELRKLILHAMLPNVAVFSGSPSLGYLIVGSRQYAHIDSGSAVSIHGNFPRCVVYGEILRTAGERNFLQSVTEVEWEWLEEVNDRLGWDLGALQAGVLEAIPYMGLGRALLERLVGPRQERLKALEAQIQQGKPERCMIEVDTMHRHLYVWVPSSQREVATKVMDEAVNRMHGILMNECVEVSLGTSTQRHACRTLIGAGMKVKQLVMPGEYVSVEVTGISRNTSEDEIYRHLQTCGEGLATELHWHGGSHRKGGGAARSSRDGSQGAAGAEGSGMLLWCTAMFRSPKSAALAVRRFDGKLKLNGQVLRLEPTVGSGEGIRGGPASTSLESPLQLTVSFARRRCRGYAFIDCETEDEAQRIVEQCPLLTVNGTMVRTNVSHTRPTTVFCAKIIDGITEGDLLDALTRQMQQLAGEGEGAGAAPAKPRVVSVNLGRWPVEVGEDSKLDMYREALVVELDRVVPRSVETGGRQFEVTLTAPRNDKAHYHHAWVQMGPAVKFGLVEEVAQKLTGLTLGGTGIMSVKQRFRCSVLCYKDLYEVLKDDLHSAVKQIHERREGGVNITEITTDGGNRRFQIVAESRIPFARAKRALDTVVEPLILDSMALGRTDLNLLFANVGMELMQTIQRDQLVRIVWHMRRRSAIIYGGEERRVRARDALLQGLRELHAEGPEEVPLTVPGMPGSLLKAFVQTFGTDLKLLEEQTGATQVLLSQRARALQVIGPPESKQAVRKAVAALANRPTAASATPAPPQPPPDDVHAVRGDEAAPSASDSSGGGPSPRTPLGGSPELGDDPPPCPICFCEIDPENCHFLEACGHIACRDCIELQLRSCIDSHEGLPLRCSEKDCNSPLLVADTAALLNAADRARLHAVALDAFVRESGGRVRHCLSPGCASVYMTNHGDIEGSWRFSCPSCGARVCTHCHVEYHTGLSCQEYRRYGADPDASLRDWRMNRADYVKSCPRCKVIIEKNEGCNHVTCKCGSHICWRCLACFTEPELCYKHLNEVHGGINDAPLLEDSDSGSSDEDDDEDDVEDEDEEDDEEDDEDDDDDEGDDDEENDDDDEGDDNDEEDDEDDDKGDDDDDGEDDSEYEDDDDDNY